MPVGSSFVFAKKLDITQKDINTVLDVLKYGTLFLPEGQLKTALSTSVKGADIGTDITYGVFALSAVNEMEFIDGVITQKYKRDADRYFNGVLDQHLSLFGYYKGVGFDIPKVLSGNITGPVPALFALHTFDVMDKTINIVLSFSILQREKIYDGLWQYFDSRRSNESHETAWEYATYGASWAIDSSSLAVGRSRKNDHKQQLETQFEALWDKWGPYTDAFGVTEEGRRLVGQEVESIVSVALEESTLVQEEPQEESFLGVLMGLPSELLWKLADGAYSDYRSYTGFLGEVYQIIRGDDAGAGLVNTSPQVVPEEIEEIERIEARLDELSRKAETLERTIDQVIASGFQQVQEQEEATEDGPEEIEEEEPLEEEVLELSFEGCVDGQINVNAASSGVLENITYIGQAKAEAIIQERLLQPFYSVDELGRVYGIGEGIVERIKEEGLACVADASQQFFGETSQPFLDPQYSPVPGSSQQSVPASCGPLSININLASTEELEGLDGIGPVLAQSIVEERENGLFSSIDDLTRVSGIAEGKVAGIKEQGCAYVDPPEESEEEQAEEQEEEQTEEQQDEEESLEEGPFPKTVVINEIAWMGTGVSPDDEWLELYNPGEEEMDLTGWTLETDDGIPTIELEGIVAASSYFVLERTDDDVISDITANQIYTGVLVNDGEVLSLSDSEGTTIDKVDAGSGWLAGDNSIKQSMERISATEEGSHAANWANNNLFTHNGKNSEGQYINGTPGAENSVSLAVTTNPDFRFTEFDSITLTKLGSPYSVVWVTVPAGKTLAIEPGVRVEFENNRGFLTIEGTLTAIGKSDNGITFTSDNNSSWCGIRFNSSSVNSELDYVTIDEASSGGAGCGGKFYAVLVEGSDIILKNSAIVSGNSHAKLYLDDSDSFIDNFTTSGATLTTDSSAIYITGVGSPTIQNSNISDSTIGIHSNGALVTPTIKNNTFTGNTFPIKLNGSPSILSENTATGNTYNGVYMEGGTGSDMTWQDHNLPYIVNTFTVLGGKTLIIQAGAEVQFIKTPSNTARIIIEGTLITQGTSESPVIFTKGSLITSWQRIWFKPTSTGSSLSHTQINYGGAELAGGALYVDDDSVVTLQDVIVQNSGTAIYSKSIEFTGSNISVLNNESGFRIANGVCPGLTSVTMSGNERDFHLASSPPSCAFE